MIFWRLLTKSKLKTLRKKRLKMLEKRGKRAGAAAVRGTEMTELRKAEIVEIAEDQEAETGDHVIEAGEGDGPEAETDTGEADQEIDTGVVDPETDIDAADLEIDTGDQGAETGGGAVKGGREKGAGVERGRANPGEEEETEDLFHLLEEELTASFTSEMSGVTHQTCPLLLRRGMLGPFSVCNLVREFELETLKISSLAWEKFEM